MKPDPAKIVLLEQMERFGDVSISIRAELAQTTLTLSELLDLKPDRVIPLSRPTGENIDIFAENVLIGWGEVLVTDGTMTVRVADLQNALLPDLQDEPEAVGQGPDQEQYKNGN